LEQTAGINAKGEIFTVDPTAYVDRASNLAYTFDPNAYVDASGNVYTKTGPLAPATPAPGAVM